ncbi:hypothetical protein ACHAQK_007172 [Fusarium lateritium]
MSAEASNSAAAASLPAIPAESPVVVQSGDEDIAMTIGMERMHVGAPGRRHFQIVWLWPMSNSKGQGNGPAYKPDVHGPKNGPTPCLPTKEELQPHLKAEPYLEIGLIIGEDPTKYKPTGHALDKGRAKAQKERGVLQRENSAMRVFHKFTDYKQPQMKVVVGCLPEHGRMTGNPDKYKPMLAKPRAQLVSDSIKNNACRFARDPPKAQVSEVVTEMEKSLAKTPLVATNLDSVVSKSMLIYSMFLKTRDTRYLAALKSALCQPTPDTDYYPLAQDDGEAAFLEFDRDVPLTDESINNLIAEVKRASPAAVEIRPEVIREVHEVLCNAESRGRKLADAFPQSTLCFFLELCNDMLPAVLTPPILDDSVSGIIQMAFKASLKHAVYTTCSPTASTAVHWTLSESDPQDDADHPTAHHRRFLTLIMTYLRESQTISDQHVKKIAEQHGALLPHDSIEDLMSKLSISTDKETVRCLTQQLGALHVGLLTSHDSKLSRKLEDLIQMIDTVLKFKEGSGQ